MIINESGSEARRAAFTVGAGVVGVESSDTLWAAAVASGLGGSPLEPDARQPDLVVRTTESRPRMLDVQNPARDGTSTATDGDVAYLLVGNAWCSVPAPWRSGPVVIECSPSFPTRTLLDRVALPTLQVLMPFRGAAAIHGTGCAVGSRGVVVAGWSESGKTETALALCESGAAFVSDKWTAVAPDRRLSALPATVGIRRWVVPHLPRLGAAIRPLPRAQLRAAGIADAVLTRVRRAVPDAAAVGDALDRVERVRALADRAALTQAEVRSIYPTTTPDPPILNEVVFLTVWEDDHVKAEPANVEDVARRLSLSAAYERRGLFELHERWSFGGQSEIRDVRALVRTAEEATLRVLLSSADVTAVHSPFPVDPHRVVEAVHSV